MRYRYVGSAEIRDALQDAQSQYRIPRQSVSSSEDVRQWCNAQNVTQIQPTFTFVVDERGVLWIADRHSEHVACARGGLVRAAGEITFDLGAKVRVTEVTNQSTGYCPAPASYAALAEALTRAAIEHPTAYTRNFDFRRCTICGLLNVVKDEDWFCAACEAPLSARWNCDPEAAAESA